jgi:hypothetical protein
MNKKILYSVLVQLLFFTSSVSAYSLLTQSTPLDTVPLAKGVTSSIGAMTKRSQVYYSFTLASGVKNLSIVTTGTSGDADIYLSKDGVRDYKGSTWKSIKSASNEKITISAPQAGTYYLTVRAWTNTKNTKATLSYTGSTVASAVVKCSYSIPTSGCSYVKGPAYSSVTGCGLVLSCANPTLSGTSSGGGGGGSSAVAVPVYQTSIPGNTSSNFSNPTSILGNSSNQNNNTSPNTNTNTVITNSALSIPSTPVSTTTTVTTPVVPNVSNPVIVTTPSTPVTTSVTTPIQISNPTTPASSPEITYIVSPNPYDFVAGTVRPDSVSKTMPCTAGGTYVVAGGWYAVPGGFRFGSYFPVDGPLGVCPSVTTSNNTAVVNTPVVTAPVISTPAVVESALCGIASGVETTVAPSSNLCRVGTPSSVSGNGPYTWSCSSISGGQPAYCSAPRTATIAPTQVNGSCGLSQNQTLSSAPSTNLCSAGVASVVTTSGNTYSWSCSGSNGGNGTSCQASKTVTVVTTVVTPVNTLAGGAGIDGPIPNVSNFNYTFCTALYMGGCSFSGLKTIRLGNGNQWVYRDYFGGFPGWYCNYANFPGSTSQQGDHCEVSDGIKTGTLTTPVNTQFANVHPFVDLSLIPLGSKGSNTLNIVSDPDTGAPNDIGAMRITCTFAKMAFNDPIVYPGQPGKSHLHTFFGNTDVNAYSTAESLATTGNSTCPGGIANRSSYWIPSLIDTSSNKAVVPSSAIWYYKTGYGGVVPSTVKPIPAGLRIIAGDANATGSQESKNIFWECQNTPGTRSATIPTNCPTGVPIALTVQFPQCWDGVNLDSANHQSHMAYPTGAGCPNTHPVPLPELSLHIQYGWSNLNTLRLSSDHNGNAAGLSLHADFFEAWDRNTMNTFITNCLNKSKDCHAYLLGNGTALLGE